MNKLTRLLAVVATTALCAGPAHAASFSFTDPGWGNNKKYDLEISTISSVDFTYSAVFSISVTGPVTADPWWANGFDFKFDGGPINDDLTINETGWSAWDDTNEAKLWSGDLPPSQYTYKLNGEGFYLSVLDDTTVGDENVGTPPAYQTGVFVGGPNSYTFNFSFDLDQALRTDGIIPFQVVYYDGINGSQVVNSQLSEELGAGGGGGGGGFQRVPEPATLLLLGSGLVGLGLVRRRKA